MAGGWGLPVTEPMEVPLQLPSQFMLPSPETPDIKGVGKLKPARPDKPPVSKDFSMASGRAQEAEMFAAAMGQAFGITKMQNKRQKAKARARERAAQAAAEKRKRR